jgi:hypothetical protein
MSSTAVEIAGRLSTLASLLRAAVGHDHDHGIVARFRKYKRGGPTNLACAGRMPVSTLARKLSLSRTTVQARLERLEREGVIAGYGVRLSEVYSSSVVRAHILITIAPKSPPAGHDIARRRPSGDGASLCQRLLRP